MPESARLLREQPIESEAPSREAQRTARSVTVNLAESPLGWHTTASCWLVRLDVLVLLNVTTRRPFLFGTTIGSGPWSWLQGEGTNVVLSGPVGPTHMGPVPLISSGVDQ